MSDEFVRALIWIRVEPTDDNICGARCPQMVRSWFVGNPKRCRAFGEDLPVTRGGVAFRLPKCKQAQADVKR